MSTHFAPARSTILKTKISTRWTQILHQLGAQFTTSTHQMTTNFAPARSTMPNKISTRWIFAPARSTIMKKNKHQMTTHFAHQQTHFRPRQKRRCEICERKKQNWRASVISNRSVMSLVAIDVFEFWYAVFPFTVYAFQLNMTVKRLVQFGAYSVVRRVVFWCCHV